MTSAVQPSDTSTVAYPATRPLEAAGSGPLETVLQSLEDSKAEDIVSIDITGKTPLSDYMVVASGRSHRHVGAIADRLVADLKKADLSPRVEGLPHCDWVLIDAGDVVVHVFRPEVRNFYNLEKMWQLEPATKRPATVT